LISGHKKQQCIMAVQAGMSRNYKMMETLFAGIIEKSISVSEA
jgi:hypothetical protein